MDPSRLWSAVPSQDGHFVSSGLGNGVGFWRRPFAILESHGVFRGAHSIALRQLSRRPV